MTEYRHDEDGRVDEIVAEARHVHVEQLYDCHWLVTVTLPDGGQVQINFWTPRTQIRVSYMEDRHGDYLEGGEFSTGVICKDNDPRVKRVGMVES